MIRAGQLRNRMSIQVPYRTRTAQGGVLVEWAVLRNIYCAVQQVYDTDLPHNAFRVKTTTRETEIANKISAYQTHRITCRAQPERLTIDMRIVNSIMKQNLPHYQVFNIIECVMLMEIRDEMTIAVKETPCDNDSATARYNVLFDDDGIAVLNADGSYAVEGDKVIVENIEWDSGEVDLTTNAAFSVTLSDRFFIDSIELVVTECGGTVSQQPTFSAGITGSTSKYISARTPTLLTALAKRQSYTQLLANDGETTSLVFTISNPGIVSAGNYKGVFVARGHSLVQ